MLDAWVTHAYKHNRPVYKCTCIYRLPPLTVVNCGVLTGQANGRVSYTSGTTIGQTATYSCNMGYNLMGSRSRTCQATGEWSGSAPTCQSMLLLHPTCMWTQCRQVFGPIHIGDSIHCSQPIKIKILFTLLKIPKLHCYCYMHVRTAQALGNTRAPCAEFRDIQLTHKCM